MIHKIVSKLDPFLKFEEAKAHCDIPCGIYDPITAQIAALTVIRMIDLSDELRKEHREHDPQFHNSFSRYVSVKEEYAEKCKHEIRIIWGDYIKEEHIKQFPELNSLVHEILQLGSKVKQNVDRSVGVELLSAVNRFAQIFWETKDVGTKVAKSPYDPGEKVVYPAL
jgi:nickel superoxide dismutase